MTYSYDFGVSDTSLLGLTIGACLDDTIERWPDATALVSRHQDLRFTWSELGAAVDEVARGLLASGHAVGDRVGLLAPNRAEWTIIEYACARLGLILVNLNPAYRAAELEYAIEKVGVRTVMAAPVFKTSDYRSMLDQIAGTSQCLDRIVYLDDPSWDDLRSDGQSASAADLERRRGTFDFDHPFSIMFTSGTTGAPKGATISHHNALNNGFSIAERLNYSPSDVLCLPLPLYHTFGAVVGNLGCLTHGAAIVLPGEAFEPASVLDAVEAERCTSIYGVPTMFIAMLEEQGRSPRHLSSLRTGAMGGSPCPVEVMRRVEAELHLAEMSIVYGMTETTVTTQTQPDDTVDRRVRTVGRSLPHVELKIVDPSSGWTVPRGDAGELCARGYSVMLQYWGEPAGTAAAIDDARWMHTGDLATMDDDGYVQIVGRIKDMVIRGGVNIYPREIEEVLHQHEDVVDVQVVGVPDEYYGEVLSAWVRKAAGSTLSADEVRSYCRDRLAHFKVPQYVEFIDEYPTTVTGKVQKYKLRELAAERLEGSTPGLEVAR